MADYKIKPLEVFALSDEMLRLTGSIPYKSLMWVRRYAKSGEFSMVVPSDVYSPDWAFIYADDRPEMGIVQKVEYDDSADTYGGVDTVTVSGLFFESALNNIVFLAESPEEKKVYVPRPKRPVYSRKQNPKIYRDPVGDLYYTNASGDVVSQKTGQIVSKDGLEELYYRPAVGTTLEGQPTACKYAYFFDHSTEGKKQVVTVDFDGNEKRYDVVMEDKRGNVFYKNEWDGLSQAVGVVKKSGYESYSVEKKRWEATSLEDSYGRYYTETVKGPWQRTEALEPVTEGDSIEIVVKWARRMMGDWLLYQETDVKGVQKKVDPSFQYLGDLLYATAAEVGASLRVEYLFEYNKFILSFYRGKDRTQSQSGNPWAVFSDTWGTLTGYTASRDESNYKNTCYVLYDYEIPTNFDASGWPKPMLQKNIDGIVYKYGIPRVSKRGYNTEKLEDDNEPTRETYLDMRDEKPSCDKDWSRDEYDIPPGTQLKDLERIIGEADKKSFKKPEDAYDMSAVYRSWEESIPGRGKAHLAENYGVITELDTGVINADGYLRDFDLGDKVDFAVSTVGLVREARIIEVEESYDESGGHIALEIGDERLQAITKRSFN